MVENLMQAIQDFYRAIVSLLCTRFSKFALRSQNSLKEDQNKRYALVHDW